jgi:hypothetical protein
MPASCSDHCGKISYYSCVCVSRRDPVPPSRYVSCFFFLLQNYLFLHQIKDLDLRMLQFNNKFLKKSEQY